MKHALAMLSVGIAAPLLLNGCREKPARKRSACPSKEISRKKQKTPLPSPMISIPAACFEMGSLPGRGRAEERPRRRVCVKEFAIERTKVTNLQYARCVAADRCPRARYAERQGYGAPELPATGVSWSDAAAYCRFMGLRLPTEAEWELAACGTDGRKYPWGNEPPDCNRAHYKGCEPDHPIPVTQRAPRGPAGTVGMVGNVWEWVADWWAKDAYANTPPRDPNGPSTGSRKVIRGGSFYDPPDYLRCRARYHWDPKARLTDVGFRCAVDKK